MPANGAVRGPRSARRHDVALTLEPDPHQSAPGLAGIEIGTASGMSISLDRGPGGLLARRRDRKGREREWTILGASRGEGGILGEGIRQALLRDPAYRGALDCGGGDAALNADIRVSDGPGRGGGRDTGGRARPRHAHGRLHAARGLRAGRRRCVPTGPAWTSGSRTSAACPPITSTRTSAWPIAALLSQVEGATVHRMRGELGPEDGAAAYENEFAEFGPDALDLILLGIGPDAHICSLFPGDDALGERERHVWASRRPEWRHSWRGSRLPFRS